MQEPTLVLGATGKIGRRVVAKLQSGGLPVRAASRRGEMRFDWFDRTTWQPALDGVRAVFLAMPEEVVPVQEFVDQAVAAGAQRLVALSGRESDTWGDLYGADMLALERAVKESGVEWSILAANNFNQNFDEYSFRESIMAGELALPTGGVPEPFVDADDVADVAVALLTEDDHAGRTYQVSGPRAITWAEAVAVIAREAGREIRFVDVAPEDFVPKLTSSGVAQHDAELLDGLFTLMRRGAIATPIDGVQRVLGREPRTFEAYAAAAAAAGAWTD